MRDPRQGAAVGVLARLENVGAEVGECLARQHDAVKGEGRMKIGKTKIIVGAGDAIFVPAGLQHNLTNIGKKRLCLYTTYVIPNYPEGLVEQKKSEGAAEVGRKSMINQGSTVPVAKP